MIKGLKKIGKLNIGYPAFVNGLNNHITGVEIQPYIDFEGDIITYDITSLTEKSRFSEENNIYKSVASDYETKMIITYFHDIVIIQVNNPYNDIIIDKNKEIDFNRLCINQNSDLYYSHTDTNSIKSYNLITQERKLYSYDKKVSYKLDLQDFSVSQDNNYLAVISDACLDIWRIKSQEIIFSEKIEDRLYKLHCSFSTDSKHLAYYGEQDWNETGYVKVIDFLNNQVYKKNILRETFKSICFYPDSNYICLLYNNRIDLWNFFTDETKDSTLIDENCEKIMFSKDKQYLIGYDDDDNYKVETVIWEIT